MENHPALVGFVPTTRGVDLDPPESHKDFVWAEDFYYSLDEYEGIDVSTYSFSWAATHNVRRAIVTVDPGPPLDWCKTKILLARNNHLKLYLCYPSLRRKPEVFLGSFNFVSPTLVDGVIRVRGGEAQHLINWFNHTWKTHYRHGH